MKKKGFCATGAVGALTAAFLFAAVAELLSSPIGEEQAVTAAQVLIQAKSIPRIALAPEATAWSTVPSVLRTTPLMTDTGAVGAYVHDLTPQGFVVTSADTVMTPVLAYSLDGTFPFAEVERHPLVDLIRWDVEARHRIAAAGTPEAALISEASASEWQRYLSADDKLLMTLSSRAEWGPLLSTAWHQGAPFNDFCPYNTTTPGTGRRPVGCVATAMAQIVNYWAYPSRVRFDAGASPEGDGYSMGSDMSFDGDADTWGFPTVSQLNAGLQSLAYDGGDREVGYLCFGAGVKLGMQYGVGGSGANTLSVERALKDGFSYGSAKGVSKRDGVWTSEVSAKVVANVKDGWPAQIAIHKSEARGGHSVVVDGYRDGDGFFHVNFGWGGTGDAWYNLPNSYEEYDVVHTVVYDIAPYQSWQQYGADQFNTYRTAYVIPSSSTIERRWTITCPKGYIFRPVVAGTGGRVYTVVSPKECCNRDERPVFWCVDEHGSVLSTIVLEEEPVKNHQVSSKAMVQDPLSDKLYLVTETGGLYRVDPEEGSATRIFKTPKEVQFLSLKADDGSQLYATSLTDGVYCFNMEGKEIWRFRPPGDLYMTARCVAVDTFRQNVYTAYLDYGNEVAYFIALDRRTGEEKKRIAHPGVSSPADGTGWASIGSDGSVYVGTGRVLSALDPDRDFLERWGYNVGRRMLRPPAIGSDGNLYMAVFADHGGNEELAIGAFEDKGTWLHALDVEYLGLDYDVGDTVNDVYAADGGLFAAILQKSDHFQIRGYRYTRESGVAPLWRYAFGVEAGEFCFGSDSTLYVYPTAGEGQTLWAMGPEGTGGGRDNNTAPHDLGQPIPADGSEVAGEAVSLSWRCEDWESPEDLECSVYLWERAVGGEGAMVPVNEGITGLSCDVSGLKGGREYFWQVFASDGQAVTEGPIWSFTTSQEACCVSDWDRDGDVEAFELFDAIDEYLGATGKVEAFDLFDAIDVWLGGGCYECDGEGHLVVVPCP